jgi:g-D-glutamyl-meso-diaminopimelate peptidase
MRIKVSVKIEPWIVDDKNKKYDYEDMTKDLQKLQKKYSGKAKLSSLGTTADNREIWCIRIGKASAKRKLVIDAAIHAREWKNVQVVMRQTEDMLRDYRDFKERFKETCIYIIPMDNPDGVSIAQYGFDAIRNKKLRKLCKKIGHADVWKANARGVDLNDNFPAGFHKKGMKKKPSYMAYPGKKAASEKETKALIQFINEINPEVVLNVHSTGSIIYWDFAVDETLHDKLYKIASKIHSFNKYPMMPASSSTAKEGGFADWLNYDKGIASITIETGSVECPLPHSEYKTIFKENYKMFRWFMTKC